MNIAYYGESGAYTHMATMNIIKKLGLLDNGLLKLDETKFLQEPTFEGLWNSVNDDTFIIFPIENSYAGNVHQNLYNFINYGFEIYAEYVMNIDHCLLSTGSDISKIDTVYSHYQSLLQCKGFVKKYNLSEVDAGDNGVAARIVSEMKDYSKGAIASSLAGEIYGLNILEKGIQDKKGNRTKFVVVGKKDSKILKQEITENPEIKGNKDITTIMFSEKGAENTPAFLYNCIGAFAKNKINLSKIESMPSYDTGFSYCFWVTFEGNIQDETIKKAIEELKTKAQDVRIIGSYKNITID